VWHSLVGEKVPLGEASVDTALPDPFFMQYIQEFSIKQGVVGSQTGLNMGFVWEFSGNGGRTGPGLRRFQI